jgi:hypothetical protein
MRFSTLTLTTLVFAAGVAAASDDLTVVSKVTSDGKTWKTSTSYLAAEHIRMARGDEHESLVDLKTGTMTELDTKKKTYYTITKKDLEELSAKMQEEMNTPEAKQAMEAMQGMGASMAASVEVKKTGAARKIAGYGCEEWVITMGTFSTTKECITSELKYPENAWAAYQDFSESMRKSMGAFGPMAKMGAEMAEKMKQMKGFPVATSMVMEIMGNKITSESEVTEVRTGSIPASVWEVPAGYTKTENPMAKSFEKHGRRGGKH